MKIMTKEQMIEENSILKIKNEQLIEKEKNLREEFSKVLGAGSSARYQGLCLSVSNPINYSWYEIFSEIGKLLAVKRNVGMREDIEKLFNAVDDIKRSLDDDISNRKTFPDNPIDFNKQLK